MRNENKGASPEEEGLNESQRVNTGVYKGHWACSDPRGKFKRGNKA